MSCSTFFKKSLLTLLTSTVLLSTSSFAATLSVGDIAPSFNATVHSGDAVEFHQWIEQQGGHYTILFSHPRDFTPVCVTELAEAQKRQQKWKDKGVNVIGLSPSTAADHRVWMEDIAHLAKAKEESFPIIDDSSLEVAKKFGMLAPDAESDMTRTAKDNYTVRSVFIINNQSKQVEAMIAYPMFIGRDFAEIDRVVDALLTVKAEGRKVAIPANWHKGDKVIVDPSTSDSEAQQYYDKIETVKLPSANTGHSDYLRFVRLDGQWDPSEETASDVGHSALQTLEPDVEAVGKEVSQEGEKLVELVELVELLIEPIGVTTLEDAEKTLATNLGNDSAEVIAGELKN